MNDELQELRNSGYKPVLVGPQPFPWTRSCATSIQHPMRRRSASWLPSKRIAARQPKIPRPNEPNRRRYRCRLLHLQLAHDGAAVRQTRCAGLI